MDLELKDHAPQSCAVILRHENVSDSKHSMQGLPPVDDVLIFPQDLRRAKLSYDSSESSREAFRRYVVVDPASRHKI